ncbi:MAG TPA: hypothetical protein VFI31_03625 [Pirellulales bacterium]|nr:hypothetical protein [Pirellulales bacterium]
MRVDHRGPLLERLINSLGLEQANPAVPAGQETLMERFSTALGQDYFARVTSAVLVATSDFDHSCLDALPDLEYLEVPSADPEVLRRAKRLGNLRVLQVTASALTPSEISSLKKQLPGCYILVTVYAPE